MRTLQRGNGDRVAICDFCYRMERPDGEWIPCRRTSFSPALFVSDICPMCCEQYVNFLLDGETGEMESDLILPAVLRRTSRSRSEFKRFETVPRKR